MKNRINIWLAALVVTLSLVLGMVQPAHMQRYALAEEKDTVQEQLANEIPADSQTGEASPAVSDAFDSIDVPQVEATDEESKQESIEADPSATKGTGDGLQTFAEDRADIPALIAQDGAQDKAFWTIAVYMCGSDLEDGGGAASGNLDIMLKADIPDNVNLLVLTGGAYVWNSADHPGYVKPDPTKTQLWRIANHQMTLLETYEYQNLADQAVLERFLNYCIDKYPAQHMMVELWNHGGGPLKGAEYSYVAGATNGDDDGDYMPLNNIAAALSNCSARFGKKFDLIGFDACLMGNVEVAYALKDSGDYLVASEEPLPGSGWNYYWLSTFGEDVFKGLGGKDASLYLAERIVDLCTQGPKGEAIPDVDVCRKEWLTYGKSETMAITDLSKMDGVKNAVQALGVQLQAVYGSDGGGKDYTKLVRATARVRGMADNELGLVDVYKLCRSIIDANINGELTAAAQALIDATGTPPAYEAGKGYVGELAKQGCMVYAAASPAVAGGNGTTIFYPAALDTDKVFLTSATTDFDGKIAGTTTNCYRRLALAQAAPDYELFVRGLASTVEPRKNYGSTIGIELDKASDKVYMTTPKDANLDSITYVEANFTSNWSDGKEYYLGNRLAAYNRELGRYETDANQQWLCVNGIPITYYEGDSNGNRFYSIPCVIIKDGADVPTGSTVDESQVSNIRVTRSWIDDEPLTFCFYTEPSSDVVKRQQTFATDTVSFRPLRRLVNEDGSYGDYVASDLVTVSKRDFGETSGTFREFLFPAVFSAPSDNAIKLSGWSFMAYDKNRKTYASDPYYLVDINVDKLEMMDISDQVYTGSAIEPKALFALGSVTELDAETLVAALPGYTYRTSYTNNINVGTATVTVEVVSDKTGEVVRTLTKQFKIVAGSEPVPTPTPQQVTYTCTSGSGQSWTKGSSTALKFTFSRSVDDKTCLSHFTGLFVDGSPVDSSYYQAYAGSTVIQLKSIYLEKLSTGKHTLTARFDDGTADASFTVNAKSSAAKATTSSKLPKTGDSTITLPLVAMLGAILVLLGLRRSHNGAA